MAKKKKKRVKSSSSKKAKHQDKDFKSLMHANFDDEDLLEQSWLQWKIGDWDSLTRLTTADLEKHSNRDTLALLAASGYQQLGNIDVAKELTLLAKKWGCRKKLISQVLAAGIHNTLGWAAVLMGQDQRASYHLLEGIRTVQTDTTDMGVLVQARVKNLSEVIQEAWASLEPTHLLFFTCSNSQNNNCESSPSLGVCNAIFHLSLTLNDQAFSIAFNPDHPDLYRVQGQCIYYQIPVGRGGYLISNESGNFNDEPDVDLLGLAPDTAYELSGSIDCDGSQSPIIWLFQYVAGKKVESQHFKTQKGCFKTLLRTHPKMTKSALGIRLGDTGMLNFKKSKILIRSSTDADVAEKIQTNLNQVETRIKASLEEKQKQLNDKNISQIESFIRLQSYMGSDFLMPEMHLWPISPDLGVLLIRLVESGGYDAIIEFGSGVSTAILAKAILNTDAKHVEGFSNNNSHFLSFEHLEKYYKQTKQIILQAGLRERVMLQLTPLIPYLGPNGKQYYFYECLKSLEKFREQIAVDKPRILVFVDGPPEPTGPHARYPVLPILLNVFGNSAFVQILMDDYIRKDEREIVNEWEIFTSQHGVKMSKKEYLKMEKQACLLTLKAD